MLDHYRLLLIIQELTSLLRKFLHNENLSVLRSFTFWEILCSHILFVFYVCDIYVQFK